jgi:hypothetical protein
VKNNMKNSCEIAAAAAAVAATAAADTMAFQWRYT